MRRVDEPVRIEGEGGAAYVEFLIAFIPLFILFMGMVQMALMYAGDLVVQHAATKAARAAVVVLDDDPRHYGGAARRQSEAEGSGSPEGALAELGRVIGGGGGGGGASIGTVGGPRLGAIRNAASIPLMAISPSFEQLTDADSVNTAIGGDPATRGMNGAMLYNRGALAVTFPVAPGLHDYRSSFAEGSQVTTRVTYLFHCGVPLANRIMCETYPTLRLGPAATAAAEALDALRRGELTFDGAMERLARIDSSRRRHERDRPAVAELDAAGSSELMYLSALTGSRFKVLRGEATLPLQYARYRYPSE